MDSDYRARQVNKEEYAFACHTILKINREILMQRKKNHWARYQGPIFRRSGWSRTQPAERQARRDLISITEQ